MTEEQRTVRVTVHDVWSTVSVPVTESMSIEEIKQRAVEQALGASVPAQPYAVKYRGALVLDEQATVGGLRIPRDAPLIVLSTVRRPVR